LFDLFRLQSCAAAARQGSLVVMVANHPQLLKFAV
tara:strand:- start:396 stop:500 length:105 start_codon:yes stop_codon:yes gene_type:complete